MGKKKEAYRIKLGIAWELGETIRVKLRIKGSKK
jgi:hypothetical protein